MTELSVVLVNYNGAAVLPQVQGDLQLLVGLDVDAEELPHVVGQRRFGQGRSVTGDLVSDVWREPRRRGGCEHAAASAGRARSR